MANKATSFNTEQLDAETMATATERVANMPGVGIAEAAPAPATASVPASPAAAAPATNRGPRAPRSDKGTTRTPEPGMVSVKFVCSVSDAVDLLAYFIRTQHPEMAHALVDAVTKAQKQSAE